MCKRGNKYCDFQLYQSIIYNVTSCPGGLKRVLGFVLISELCETGLVKNGLLYNMLKLES